MNPPNAKSLYLQFAADARESARLWMESVNNEHLSDEYRIFAAGRVRACEEMAEGYERDAAESTQTKSI